MLKKILAAFGICLSMHAAAQTVEKKSYGQEVLAFPKAQSIYDTLTTEAKVFGLSTFWKEASYNFVFFDKVNLNWDSLYYSYLPKVIAAPNIYEYSKILDQFAKALNDGHTGIFTPDFFWKDIGRARIMWEVVDNRRFVNRIDETLLKEIPLGTEVVAIDDLSFDDFIAKGRSLNGIKGTTVNFTFKSKDGKQFKKEMVRLAGKDHSVKFYPPFKSTAEFEFKILEKNIAYVRINNFESDSIPIKFRNEISRINKATAVIIDIRENGGGNTNYAIGVAQHLTNKPFMVGSAWKTRIHKAANKAWASSAIFGDTSEWTKQNFSYLNGNEWEHHAGDTIMIDRSLERVNVPVYILIGEKTFSAAEDFLILLDGSKNIKLVGKPTAGSSGQPLMFDLPYGMMARICAKRDTYPDGRDFIGVGVKPDIYVKRTVEDYRNAVDSELKAVIAMLKKK
jgi:carboxyl-terminal processing protease